MGVQRPPLTALWVDMGLPSGNRWAVSNLDATGPYYFQESPFQHGCSFFSWGNVTPHNPVSETEFDYDFGGVNSAAPYYEGQPYGDTPGSLLTGDIPLTMDAARKMLGGPWHMPTRVDWIELFANVIYIDAEGNEVDSTKTDKRVTVNGVIGLYLQSKINGVRMFVPSSGGAYNKSWAFKTTIFCWVSDWYSNREAWSIVIGSSVQTQRRSDRFYGFPIRPIWNPKDLRG